MRKPKWEGVKQKRLLLHTNESGNLIVAEFSLNLADSFDDMRLMRLRDGELGVADWERWNLDNKEILPENDLRLSLFADGVKEPIRKMFTLKPEGTYGPLQMLQRGE